MKVNEFTNDQIRFFTCPLCTYEIKVIKCLATNNLPYCPNCYDDDYILMEI